MVEVIQADRDRLHELERYLHVSHSGPFLTDDALDVLARHRIEAQSELQATVVRLEASREALLHTQAMLETIVRTNSTCFSEVRERIMANRSALSNEGEG